jgi:hypothetical protein
MNFNMRVCLLLLLVGAVSVKAQDTARVRSFTLHSFVLNEERNFSVYLPSSGKGAYEVLYVLDGRGGVEGWRSRIGVGSIIIIQML